MSCTTTSCSRTNTQLRQGTILSNSEIASLNLESYNNDDIYLIISHDCDLMASLQTEEKIEIIKCIFVEPDGNLTFGANVRKLHLPINHQGILKHIEVRPQNKILIDKDKCIGLNPDGNFILTPKNLKLLQAWLAARYRRHAFPDTLTERLKKVEKSIQKIGKTATITKGIISVFIEVDPPTDELPEDQPYELNIFVVYDSEAISGKANATSLFTQIKKAIENAQAQGEALEANIEIRADTEFTLKDIRNSSEWRFEYLSFRGEEIGELIEP